MTEYEQMVDKLAEWLCAFEVDDYLWNELKRYNYTRILNSYRESARSLLSLEHEGMRLAVVRKEGKLPPIPVIQRGVEVITDRQIIQYAQQDMLKAHYVQEVRSE